MRSVVVLAIRSGLGSDYWLGVADPRELDTALDLLADEAEEAERAERAARRRR